MSRVEELERAAARGDWPAYFRALGGRVVKLKRADLDLPPPVRTSREEWPEGLKTPAGAARLERLAEELGWEVRLQYARGHRWGVGTAQVEVHSVAVRLHHRESGRSAVALWEAKVSGPGGKLAWSTDDAWRWSTIAFPVKLGVEELKAWMRGES